MLENIITTCENVFQKEVMVMYIHSTKTFAWQAWRSAVSNAVYVQLTL